MVGRALRCITLSRHGATLGIIRFIARISAGTADFLFAESNTSMHCIRQSLWQKTSNAYRNTFLAHSEISNSRDIGSPVFSLRQFPSMLTECGGSPRTHRHEIAVLRKPARKKPKQNVDFLPEKYFFSPNDGNRLSRSFQNGFLICQASILPISRSDGLFFSTFSKRWAYFEGRFRFGMWLYNSEVCRIYQFDPLQKANTLEAFAHSVLLS